MVCKPVICLVLQQLALRPRMRIRTYRRLPRYVLCTIYLLLSGVSCSLELRRYCLTPAAQQTTRSSWRMAVMHTSTTSALSVCLGFRKNSAGGAATNVRVAWKDQTGNEANTTIVILAEEAQDDVPAFRKQSASSSHT